MLSMAHAFLLLAALLCPRLAMAAKQCDQDPAIAQLQRALASEHASISPRHSKHAHLNPLSVVPPIRLESLQKKHRRRRSRRRLQQEPLGHLPMPAEYAYDQIVMNATVLNWTHDPHTISDVKGGWARRTSADHA